MDARLKIENFKSYGSDGINVDQIKPINLVIGRNNSGKSAILDAIEAIYSGSLPVSGVHHHRGQPSKFTFIGTIPQHLAQQHFQSNTNGGWIGGNHWELGRHLVETRMEIDFSNNEFMCKEYFPGSELQNIRAAHPPGPILENPNFQSKLREIAKGMPFPFEKRRVVRLSAERDITPEPEHGNKLIVSKNGTGITTAISQVILSTKYDSSLVERDLLFTINEILSPDIHISAIKTRKHEHGAWEIFLEEDNKGTISLSNSGSGLKTIILTASLFELIPKLDGFKISDSIYLLEELENNLHPALQRKLLDYIKRKIGSDGIAFITSHSSAIIDMFNHEVDAQLFHVQQKNGTTTAHVANTYVHHRGVLDDLDVRASDVLQSNGIIWVEGPSDRTYVNKWVELISGGSLKEGRHYQCVFYGGRLLSHLSGSPPDSDELEEAISIFRANRNAAILIDSDKKNRNSKLNQTKSRIQKEFRDIDAFCWITRGREIENYIAKSTLSRLPIPVPAGIEPYDSIEDFLVEQMGDKAGKAAFKSKVLFAEAVCSVLTVDDLNSDVDLMKQIGILIDQIKLWNGE